MSLKAKLEAMKAESAKKFESAILETMAKATRDLELSGILESVPKAGDPAPGFTLKDAEGSEVASESLLAKGPLLITLYRGIW